MCLIKSQFIHLLQNFFPSRHHTVWNSLIYLIIIFNLKFFHMKIKLLTCMIQQTNINKKLSTTSLQTLKIQLYNRTKNVLHITWTWILLSNVNLLITTVRHFEINNIIPLSPIKHWSSFFGLSWSGIFRDYFDSFLFPQKKEKILSTAWSSNLMDLF